MQIRGGLAFDLDKGFIARDIFTDGQYISHEDSDGAILDASGCYVIPGLLDVHFHGCAGEDFSDASYEGLCKIARFELSQGVTHICPAGMTLPEEQLDLVCKNAADFKHRSSEGAELVGIHLEGPFLSTAKKGAQNGSYLHAPDIAMLRRLQRSAEGLVRLVTVAPEEPGALDFIRAASADGISVSLGHTTADYATARRAFAAGANHATHLFNAMPPIHHREPGLIVAAAENPAVMPELICDGIHVHEAAIRFAFSVFGRERMVLISDSLRATGMPDGEYPFAGQMIELHGKRATILGQPDTLAGSVSSLMDCLRYTVSIGIPLADAVRAASYNPACSIGLDNMLGTLDAGKAASLVLLDKKNLETKAVVHRGKLIQAQLCKI